MTTQIRLKLQFTEVSKNKYSEFLEFASMYCTERSIPIEQGINSRTLPKDINLEPWVLINGRFRRVQLAAATPIEIVVNSLFAIHGKIKLLLDFSSQSISCSAKTVEISIPNLSQQDLDYLNRLDQISHPLDQINITEAIADGGGKTQYTLDYAGIQGSYRTQF